MKQEGEKAYHYLITVPNYRLDVRNQEDLVEEIARIYGYDNIPSALPSFQQKKIVINKNQIYRDLIRQSLSNLGYQEIITYSLVSEKEKKGFCFSSEEREVYRLLSPKSKNHIYYRQSLLSSHLKTIAYNLARQVENLFFFEISKIYFLTSAGLGGEEILALSGTGAIMSGPVHNLKHNYDFFWLKGILEGLFTTLNINKISFVSSQIKELHPYQSADIFLNQKKIGFLGQIHPQTRKEYQLDQPVFGAQISLSKLFIFLAENSKLNYQTVSLFPKIEQDLSFYLAENIPASKIIEIIEKNGILWLKEVRVFDAYQSKEDKKNKQKALAFRLTFQSQERTLQKPEIDEIVQKIIQQVQNLLSAKLKA